MSLKTDTDFGREGLLYFHNAALSYPKYKLKFDELIMVVGGKYPEIFLENFGYAIRINEMRTSQLKESMISLADRGQGLVPKNNTVFFQALSERVSTLSTMDWVIATPQVVIETSKEVAVGFQQVGNAVLDTGKSLLVVGPLIALGAILFIVWGKTKSYAGS